MNKEEGITTVYDGPSHVVILGAGASIASTLHNPEPSGKTLPSMDNLVQVVGLDGIDEVAELVRVDNNFEAVFSSLYSRNSHVPVIERIERQVREYFQGLHLPPTPTIYDYLALSLRPKDLIATFNWDPFLVEAVVRNRHVAEMPRIAFLHGNVAIEFSEATGRTGPPDAISMTTHHYYAPTRLLYPIAQKDSQDPFIRLEWAQLDAWLKGSKRVTIFGYGAPETDVKAVDLMSKAWGDPDTRDMEQVEIIDIQSEDAVCRRWERFICRDHVDYCTDYFEAATLKATEEGA